jgi:hypothetical protein
MAKVKKLDASDLIHVRLHRSRTETFYWDVRDGSKIDKQRIPLMSANYFVPEKQYVKSEG